jgi:hypothetical protein
LNDGKYTIEITKDFEIGTIEVKNGIVSYINTNSKTIHKPVVRNENENILISKLALQNAEMKVELYFEDDLIHSETVKGGQILNRIYKLDKTLKGNYTTIIRSDDRVFINNFSL